MPESIDVLLPLNTRVFYVLLALAEEERHGYAISKAVEALTAGKIRLTPGTLYPVIHQMLADEWIAPAGDDDDDSRRRRYKLTARGRRIAQAEARRLDELVSLARSFKLLPAVRA